MGGGVCKKRVPVAGQGKSGSVRTLVAKKHRGAIFFLVGREKSSPGSDFADREVAAAKVIAHALEGLDVEQLNELLTAQILKEICHVE